MGPGRGSEYSLVPLGLVCSDDSPETTPEPLKGRSCQLLSGVDYGLSVAFTVSYELLHQCMMLIVPVHSREIAPVIAKEIAVAQLSAFHRPLNNFSAQSSAINILRVIEGGRPLYTPNILFYSRAAENGMHQLRPKERLIQVEIADADPFDDPADLVGQRPSTTRRHAARP
jgi:hypothetical protein